MLRTSLMLVLTMVPAMAWETTVGRVCELSHDGENASVLLTYDPAIPEYSIAITPQAPWPDGPVFAMRFDGPQGNMITTDRHMITGNGATLTVTDSGFGNVLNGLEFNETATALLGDREVSVSLEGAAPAVQDFRNCTESPSV